MRQKIAPLPCWPHLTWPQRKANGLPPTSSAAHAALPPPGWKLSLLRGLWSSRAGSSRRASATASVPPSWPPMHQCDVDHGMRCQALTAQTTLRRVLHRASSRCLSLPSAGYRASSKGWLIQGGAQHPCQCPGRHPSGSPPGHHLHQISVAHPLSKNTLSEAGAEAGAAASRQDQQKRNAYVHVEPNGYTCAILCRELWAFRQAGDKDPA
jgi:hypothetical protein